MNLNDGKWSTKKEEDASKVSVTSNAKTMLLKGFWLLSFI